MHQPTNEYVKKSNVRFETYAIESILLSLSCYNQIRGVLWTIE